MADMKWNAGQALDAAKAGADRGLEAAAAHVLAKSQEIVPFIKGDLSRSGQSGMVGEGRAGVTYTERGAIDAHERMDITPANGRERKFLERSLVGSKDEAARLVQREIRKALGQ